mgnify:CR=1 FL=1
MQKVDVTWGTKLHLFGKRKTEHLTKFTCHWKGTPSKSTKSTDKKIIPVVVHVIHNFGSENVTDAQVADAIRILNDNINGQDAAFATRTPDVFAAVVGKPNLEFRLEANSRTSPLRKEEFDFKRSAKDCNNPNAPTTLGPLLFWTRPHTLRSNHTIIATDTSIGITKNNIL